MSLKAAYKNASPWVQILIFIGLFILGSVISSFVGSFVIILQETGFIREIQSMEDIPAFMQNLLDNTAYLKQLQFLSQLGTFVLPVFFCAWLFSDNYKTYLKLDHFPKLSIVGLTILCVIILFPFINLTLYLNQQMVLPEWLNGLEVWMKQSEEANNALLERMLVANNLQMLLMNLVVMAVLPGFGEEILFRGLGQNIIGRMIKNQHAVIWIVAIIFSAIHNQYYGFFPRMFLGAAFGYLLYYTRSMWIPIIAHFTHNAISVIIFYISQDSPEKMEQIDVIGMGSTWWLGVASLALFLFLFMQIKKQSPKHEETSLKE